MLARRRPAEPTGDQSGNELATPDLTLDPSGCAVITLHGEQDIYTVVATRCLVLEGIRVGHGHVIIDLTAVTFADSSLLGSLALAIKVARKTNGSVRLVSRDERLISKLKITGMARLFPLFPALPDALAVAL